MIILLHLPVYVGVEQTETMSISCEMIVDSPKSAVKSKINKYINELLFIFWLSGLPRHSWVRLHAIMHN